VRFRDLSVQHADTLPVPFQTTETNKRRSPFSERSGLAPAEPPSIKRSAHPHLPGECCECACR
jgi:hypothetical protein